MEAFLSSMWFWWFLGGAVWGIQTYAGLLARVQRLNPRNAEANFWVDFSCSLIVALVVFLCFPLGALIYLATRGFRHGHQFWRRRT